jgi:cysteinyl-tRNA synthetase
VQTSVTSLQVPEREECVAAYVGLVEACMGLLGVATGGPEGTLRELRELALIRAGITEEEILAGIAERALARKDKDFSRADNIRETFATKGINFQDTPNGTTWRPTTLI